LLLLARPHDVGDVQALARGLTFFVMAFQDVLRLTARQVRDPRLTGIARTHHAEDAGHEQWFLNDLRHLGVDVTVGYIFSSRHEISRDVGYALVSEVLQAQGDAERLAVVFALEAIGHLFFEPAIRLFEQRQTRGLQYFARRHQQVEADHEMFEDDTEATLAAVTLTDAALARALGAVDRVFALLARLGGDLAGQIRRAPEAPRSEHLFSLEDAHEQHGRLDNGRA
jgi:hypothetical protein